MPAIVYIIDDDADDRDLLEEAIKDVDSSIECHFAENGQEGLRKLQTNSIPLPSIIFLDLNMPRITGKQVLRELKKTTAFKHIPVIVYTTSSYGPDRDETKKLGAADYIIKQSDYSELKSKLIRIFQKVFLTL